MKRGSLLMAGGAVAIGLIIAFVYMSLPKDQAIDRAAGGATEFDQAVTALEFGDLDEARHLLQSVNDSRERELIEIGLLLREANSADSLKRLDSLEIPDVPATARMRSVRLAYLSRAHFMISEFEDAKHEARLALEVDPECFSAQQQAQFLQEYDSRLEDDELFVTTFRGQVDAFCGDCHVTPDPGTYPRERWRKEVDQGFSFYKLFKRADLSPPDPDKVLRWYQLQAPEELDIYDIMDRPHVPMESPQFAMHPSNARPSKEICTTNLKLIKLQAEKEPVLIVCNGMTGSVTAFDPRQPDGEQTLLATLQAPAHVEPCDLNNDMLTDLVVADLGTLKAEDHLQGKVVYLRAKQDGRFETIVLLENVGRVADVRPGDFDGDGDTDLIVAEFGWRTTGRLLQLKNVSKEEGKPEFETQVIDSRHGSSHVPTVDLNNDGHLDFICLFSQAHETVVAFINDGTGQFKEQTLFNANDPSWGSSGITLVDLDDDGDQDVLYTNGDTFDRNMLSPDHGVQWLENKGDLEFEHHELLKMFGAYCAVATDVDNDGDQDVVAGAALIGTKFKPDFLAVTDSLVCLLNDGQQNFEYRVMEKGILRRATLIAEDFDGDGDKDIAAGRFTYLVEPPPVPPFDIFQNQLVK